MAACKKLFCTLLNEEKLFRGALHGSGEEQEDMMGKSLHWYLHQLAPHTFIHLNRLYSHCVSLPPPGSLGPEDKYRLFMRLRYSSCVETLLELLDHEDLDVRVRTHAHDTPVGREGGTNVL